LTEAIRTRSLTKRYKDITAVDGVDLCVLQGEVYGLLGPNGAGKTTTVRLLATVIQPTSGTASVLGCDIREQPEEVRRSLGVLTTEVGVYDRFSARENLAYYGRLYGLTDATIAARIAETCRLLQMEDFIDRRAGKYSTGMKQKVAIARTLIHDPPILILDEPTAGLDVLASQTVIRFIQHARERGKTVILSTHIMPIAQKLCDRVGIIHQGKLIAEDATANLLARTGAGDLEDAFLALVGAG
jgi:sodium transport system ATP-binding protein